MRRFKDINAEHEYVLTEDWGGLGDALAYSTLPEMFLKCFRKETYVSNLYIPRNSEIAELVWWRNPYILGWSSLRPNAGSAVPYHSKPNQSFIENVETSHGLEPRNSRPKIYYEPSKNSELKSYQIIDLSAVTASKGPFQISPELLRLKVLELIDLHGLQNSLLIYHSKLRKISNRRKIDLTPSEVSFSLEESFPSIRRLEINSIFDYADAIASCRRLVGLHSGSVALAAAILDMNPSLEIECLVSPNQAENPNHSKLKRHTYPDVKYTLVG